MALGKEIQDFLGSYHAVTKMKDDHDLAQAHAEYYKGGGRSGGLTPEEVDRRVRAKYGDAATGAVGTSIGARLERLGNWITGKGTSGSGSNSTGTADHVWDEQQSSAPVSDIDPEQTVHNDLAADTSGDDVGQNTQAYADGGVVERMRSLGRPQQSLPQSFPDDPVYASADDPPVQTVAPAAPPQAVVPAEFAPTGGPSPMPAFDPREQQGPPAPAAGAVPARTSAGNSAGKVASGPPESYRADGVKHLTHQGRTEAYDPVLDKDDPDNHLRAAINGAMEYAGDTFHLNPRQNDAVGSIDPHHAGGVQAFNQGVGAAPQKDIEQLNQVVAENLPDKRLLTDPNVRDSVLGVRRLSVLYDHYMETGQTDKANKAAFEILQYSASAAAKYGQMAVNAIRAGDNKAGAQYVARAHSQIPDGNHVVVGPDGKTAQVRNERGEVQQTLQFTPEQLLNTALGLSNKSAFWQILNNRAQMVGKQGQSQIKQDIDAARLENIKARTDAIKARAGRGTGVAAPPPPNPIRGDIDEIDRRTGVAPTNPNQGAVDQPAASPQQAAADPVDQEIYGDNDIATNAPADLKNTPAPDSVLRTPQGKKDMLRQGTSPSETPVTSPGNAPPGNASSADPKYQQWLKDNKLSEDPDYDMQGAYKAGAKPDARGHMTDQYKKPSHPTFSNESVYSSKDNEGGEWIKQPGNKWAFKPGPANIKNGIDKTKEYLKQNDPDVKLLDPSDDTVVPDQVIHGGKYQETQVYTPPPFDEEHPGAKLKGTPYEGRNPYTVKLQDPTFRKWVAAQPRGSKYGTQDLQELQSREREFNKRVADWEKAKKAHDKEYTDAHNKDVAQTVADAKAVYDRSLSERDLQEVSGEVERHAQDLTQPGKDGKPPPPSIFMSKSAKPEELSQLAVNLHTSNKNMTPGMAVQMVKELTTPGTDPKERVFTPLGRDAAGNVVLKLKDHDDVQLHVRPGAYAKINSLTDKYRTEFMANAKKPKEEGSLWQQAGDQALAFGKKITDPAYLLNRDLPQGGGSIADLGRAITYPARAGMKYGPGIIEKLKAAALRQQQNESDVPPNWQ